MEESAASTITVHPHYLIAARELQKIIKVLQDAFIHRPVLSGLPYRDLESAVTCICDRILEALAKLASPFDRVDELLASEHVMESVMEAAVKDVGSAIARLIDSYHGVWRLPFPDGYEKGQILLSVVVEQVLRKILAGLEQAVKSIEHPEQAVPGIGVVLININIDLTPGPEEAELNRWVDSLVVAKKRDVITCAARQFSFLSLLLAFLFGWLIGKDD